MSKLFCGKITRSDAQESDTVNINLSSIKQPHRLLVGCFFLFLKNKCQGHTLKVTHMLMKVTQ